ncbi:MAG: LTA synthase family protein [bacterium]|nr:LTA synthase family protein [bacterium]
MNSQKVTHLLSLAFLPAILTLFLVAENQLFVLWLHVVPDAYWVRCSLATLSLGVLVYGISLFIRSRVLRYGYLFVTSCILSLILLSEYLYYSYAASFLQISALQYTAQVLSLFGIITTLLTPKLLLFIIPPTIVILSYFFPLLQERSLHHKSHKIIIGTLIILAGLGGYGWLAIAETRDFGSANGLFKTPYDTSSIVGKMGIVNYFLEGVVKLAIHSNDVTKADKIFVQEWSRSRPETQSAASNYGIAKGRNLILIQVESLENVVLHATVEKQEITPNLNALAKNGAYFKNVFTQIGHGTTADAEFMILNSLYSLPDGVAFVDYPRNSYQALPRLLTDNGYHTLVMHGDVATFWNRANIYPQLGYQQWAMKNDFTTPREIGYQGLGDADFFSQSAEKLRDTKKPFMSTLITLTSHSPFLLPDDLRTLKFSEKSKLNETQKHYLESIHYVDAAIGTFIADLKKFDLYNNSLIVLYGDHGSFTDISNALAPNKHLPKDVARQHVPLIMVAPKTTLAGVNSSPASLIDIYPTVTNLLGLETPRSVLGQDLLNTKTPVMTYRKSSTHVKYILSNNLSYTAETSGIFERGTCADNDLRPLPIESCRKLFEEQKATLTVSDVVIKANMLNTLTEKVK